MESATPTKKIDVLDSMYISVAWNEISPDVITNCFGKTKFFDYADYTVEECGDDLQILEEYLGYAAIVKKNEVATNSPKSLGQKVIDNHVVTGVEDENEEEYENVTFTIPVTKAFDYVNDIKKIDCII